MKIPDKTIRAYALKNALHYNGKANQGAVISALFNEGMKKEEVKNYSKIISEIIKEINLMSFAEQEKEFEKFESKISERETREGLPELPNVPKTGVIMRFAPSASGPMHIGHALTASLSFLYVKKYGGKFYFRIEDTNPENIYGLAYKMLESEAKWLFENKVIVLIQSDRMKLYYKYAEKLIKKESAYVCTCSQEEFKKFADSKKECPCRNLSIKENLMKWEKMLAPQVYTKEVREPAKAGPDKSSKKISTEGNKNGFSEGEAVLRFKSNMQDSNPAMRDFPLARINLHKHSLQKNKYRVWPLMNLSVTVDDIEMKITHIIRGKDHADNAKRQEMIYKVLGLEKKFPWTFFMGRMKFTDIILSKRKLNAAIKEGKYSGAEDARLPTISSLKKRGYKPEAFAKFAEQRGLTDVDKVISQEDFFKVIDIFNQK